MLETPILPGQLYYTIYLPPCYSDEREYPVLYLFHGLSYSDDQWVRLGMTDAADRLIGTGEVAPLVIVLPYNPKADRPPHSNFGSAFTGALIPYIDTHYSTQIDAEGRWIGGLSRGGGWVFDIFSKNPELFGMVGGHSPALFQRVPERFLESMEKAWSGQRIWLDVGEQDKELNYLTRVDADLTTANIPHVFVVESGEHDEIYWRAHVEEYLRWYAEK
jgi:enterochelin esterase-like enzyme